MTKQEGIRIWAEDFLRGIAHNGFDSGEELTMLQELSDLGVVIKSDVEYVKGSYYGEDASQQLRLVESLIEFKTNPDSTEPVFKE